jgi:hypothetical protein
MKGKKTMSTVGSKLYYLFTLLYAALPKWLKLEDIVAKMPPFFAGVLMAHTAISKPVAGKPRAYATWIQMHRELRPLSALSDFAFFRNQLNRGRFLKLKYASLKLPVSAFGARGRWRPER